MLIQLTKNEHRHHLRCRREDGSTTQTDIGPALPIHDLAHYVVESYFKMPAGFYGNIANGYSIAELSDKEVIKTLPPAAMVAEVMTRNLQGLVAPTVDGPGQYIALVRWEAEVLGLALPPFTVADVVKMGAQLRRIVQKWDELKPGEQLELTF